MTHFLWAQQTATPEPISLFFQYGVAGLVIAAILAGFLWAKPAVDDLKERARRAEDQRDEMLKVYEERIIPKLVASDEILTSMKPVLLDVVKVMESVKSELGRST